MIDLTGFYEVVKGILGVAVIGGLLFVGIKTTSGKGKGGKKNGGNESN